MILNTSSPEETRAWGARLGRLLRPLDCVCLSGELGAGKTTFVQGLARGAGCRGRVTSPTFALARTYRGRRLSLHHLDLYRVGEGETGDIGLEEYARDSRAACVVEWPDAGAAYWPKDRLEIALRASDGGRSRRVAAKASGPRSRELLRKLGA